MDPAESPKQILTPEEARKVQQKAITNIVRKIASGRAPTAGEWKIVNAASGQAAEALGLHEWAGSYEALGKIVGLHRASFPRLIRDHKDHPLLPQARANGDHHVPAWQKFLAAVGIKCKSGGLTEGNEDKPTKSDLEWEKLFQQCRELKRVADEKAGLLIPKAEVDAWLTGAIEAIKSILRNKLKNELPPKLEGLRAPEIAAKMEDVIAAVCRELRGAPRGKEGKEIQSGAEPPQSKSSPLQ